MNIDDFWCRAFLEAMGDHTIDLERCEEIANGALWRAQKNGMVPSARPGNDLPADPPRPAPTLERVAFTTQRDMNDDTWCIGVHDVGAFRVIPGEERRSIATGSVVHTIRIKWGETSPPKPIEVWLERPAAISPEPPGMSDAEVAAEFYRRFIPVRVLVGDLAARTAFAEDDHGSWLSGVRSSGGSIGEHPAGEPGFVAAVLRARELVRKGGA